MDNKFLQPFLRAGLIDIDNSDDRLTNIEQSIADLQAAFEKDYSVLPTYTLVALDPATPADEQVVIDTEAIIIMHWRVLRLKFPEPPTPIIRAVILNALYNVGINDSQAARIIYLTASNVYPYSKLGKEREMVEQIISELGDLAEQDATEAWSLSDEEPDFKLATLKLNGIKVDTIKADAAKLIERFTVAANQLGFSGNYNNYQLVNQQNFANHAATAVSEAIDSVSSGLVNSIDFSTLESSINKFFSDFKKSLDRTLKNSFNSITAVERRSKLLWWKETLYSPSIKNSYRTLNAHTQPIIMAADLYELLPEVSPASVDFLLKDTLLILNSNASERISFGSAMKEFSTDANKLLLKDYIKLGKETGRITITDFFALLVNDKAKISDFSSFTGISEDELTSLSDISVIVLHDLLTRFLTSE